MDSQSQQSLARLVRGERIASLGTLFHGAPLVSLVLFSAAADLSAIDIHVSRLAQHTQGLLESGRVGVMMQERGRRPASRIRLVLRLLTGGLADAPLVSTISKASEFPARISDSSVATLLRRDQPRRDQP